MTCREVADFLADYVSGTLPADVATQFERHLSLCPNCRAYISTYRATIELGRFAFIRSDANAESAVPEDLVSAIMDAVRR